MTNKKYPQSVLLDVVQKNKSGFGEAFSVMAGLFIIIMLITFLINPLLTAAFVVGMTFGMVSQDVLFGRQTGFYLQTLSKQLENHPELSVRVADAMQTELNPIPPLFGVGDEKLILEKRRELGEKFHDNS